jgi:hypothetical protein
MPALILAVDIGLRLLSSEPKHTGKCEANVHYLHQNSLQKDLTHA